MSGGWLEDLRFGRHRVCGIVRATTAGSAAPLPVFNAKTELRCHDKAKLREFNDNHEDAMHFSTSGHLGTVN